MELAEQNLFEFMQDAKNTTIPRDIIFRDVCIFKVCRFAQA